MIGSQALLQVFNMVTDADREQAEREVSTWDADKIVQLAVDVWSLQVALERYNSEKEALQPKKRKKK